jgi:hypothetical protein
MVAKKMYAAYTEAVIHFERRVKLCGVLSIIIKKSIDKRYELF